MCRPAFSQQLWRVQAERRGVREGWRILSIDGPSVGCDASEIQAKLALLQRGHRSFEIGFEASFESAVAHTATALCLTTAESHTGAYRHAILCCDHTILAYANPMS